MGGVGGSGALRIITWYLVVTKLWTKSIKSACQIRVIALSLIRMVQALCVASMGSLLDCKRLHVKTLPLLRVTFTGACALGKG